MASLIPVFKQRFFDSNGDPLSGGKLYSYIAGTSTPRGTYQDEDSSVPNTNPIILDSAGYAPLMYGSGSYKFILTNSSDVTQFTVDDITVGSGDESEDDSGWSTHTVTDGQAATALSGETLDLTLYSAALYDIEIARNSRAIVYTGPIAIQKTAASARVVTGVLLSDDAAHGVTFDCTVSSNVATMRAALSSGSGDGTIKLRRRLVPL